MKWTYFSRPPIHFTRTEKVGVHLLSRRLPKHVVSVRANLFMYFSGPNTTFPIGCFITVSSQPSTGDFNSKQPAKVRTELSCGVDGMTTLMVEASGTKLRRGGRSPKSFSDHCSVPISGWPVRIQSNGGGGDGVLCSLAPHRERRFDQFLTILLPGGVHKSCVAMML